MPILTNMLKEYDTGLQLIIAAEWGVEQDLDQKTDIASQMAEQFLGNQLVNELVDALSQGERRMIEYLIREEGKLQRDQAERVFGIIREMGAARRQKERPDQNPVSVAEALYYKGLIGTAFLNWTAGIEEYVFIPDDVLAALQHTKGFNSLMQLSAVYEDQVARRFITSDAILDHACILLAALRSGKPVNTIKLSNPRIQSQFLLQLLNEICLVNDDLYVKSEQVRIFLGEKRCLSFLNLVHAWRLSPTINELRLLVDLEFEGNWRNEPQKARENLICIISQLPSNTWFRVDSFIQWVHQFHPDFQRTAGEYDAWFIREGASGSYLKGFENWFKVEGCLLEFMLTGPLFWLGYLDLGFTSTQPAVTVFKLSSWSESLLQNGSLNYLSNESKTLMINNHLELRLERPFVREHHYQIARFCDWVRSQKNQHIYRITTNSLQLAEKQGISIKQILALINKLVQKPIPPNVTAVLKNWQNRQSRVTIEKPYLIQVASPDIMEQLISAGLKGQILERISPTSARIRQGSLEKIQAALLDMGYLASFEPEV